MTENSNVAVNAEKIWDYNDIWRADGGKIPGGVDDGPSGEIHPCGLMRYKGWWYCGIKEQPLRRMRLIRSRDGKQWESVHMFTWQDATVYEGKFSVTGEGAFMITSYIRSYDIGASSRDASRKSWTASVNWLSYDGVHWDLYACPTGYSERNLVRWSATWFRGAGYSIARTKGDLYKTLDGKSWAVCQAGIYASWKRPATDAGLAKTHDPLDIRQKPGAAPDEPHEAEMAFDFHDGSACAVARMHPLFAIIGTAAAPDYGNWQWREARLDWDGDGKLVPAHEKLGVQIGGPCLRYLSNGVLLLAGRYDASPPDRPGSKGPLALFIVDRERGVLRRWVDFEEAGYGRQYPGMVEHEGELWITTGPAVKEKPYAVYLLKLPLPEFGGSKLK